MIQWVNLLPLRCPIGPEQYTLLLADFSWKIPFPTGDFNGGWAHLPHTQRRGRLKTPLLAFFFIVFKQESYAN